MSGLKVGDSVTVKQGVTDPDLGMEIGGWQGRILDVHVGEVTRFWLVSSGTASPSNR